MMTSKQSKKTDQRTASEGKHISGIGAAATRKKSRSSLLTFLLIMVVLSSAGVFYLYSEIRQIKSNAAKELTSVADLKVEQISNWVSERYADAQQILNTPRMGELANIYLHNPLNIKDKATLLQWMQMYQGLEDYKQLSLLNTDGKIVISVPKGISRYSDKHNKFYTAAIDSGKIIVADLHRESDGDGGENGDISYSYWIPLFGSGVNNHKVTGVWVLQIDPYKFLYPLVQSWPVSSKTAETLLVRKEGEQVVFLNELRHRKDSAVKLKFNISDNPLLPASLAVMGKEGILAGNDYRGVPVLTASRKVVGTSWYMLAKVDKKELYESLWPRIWVTAFVMFILMLSVAAFVGYLERKRDADWLKRQLILEQEKIEASKAVIDSEFRFRELFEHMSNGVSVYQPTEDGQDFIIMDINPEGQRITKSKREDILGKRVGDVFPDLKRKGLLDVFIEVSRTGIAKRCDTHNYIDNQLEYWLDNYVLKLDSGEVVALYHDITREVIAKNELHESNEYLQSLFNYANAPIIVWDSHFKIERFNHAFERLTQYQAAEVLGEHLELLFPPESRMDSMAKIRAASQGNNWVSVELPIQRKDGHVRIILCNSANIYDHDGEAVLSTFAQGQDITDRIKADDALKKLNEELENRVNERTALLETANNELESFSYSVSHDLRSPLRGIEGWSQALAEDYAGRLDEQADDYLRRIRTETERMNQLIEGLLKLSRVGKAAIIPETLNLSQIAQSIVDRLREEEPLRKVEITIMPDLMAQGDSNLLKIVLMNLLSNAWKFTQRTKHACIEIGCECKELAGENHGRAHNVFFIRDNGAGFDMAYATKLFSPFQRLHKATDFPGTGVGLATVQRIIRRHDGDIWVEAEPEKGATFFFYLGEQ